MKKISVLIPVYNESANLERLHEALIPLFDNKLTSGEYEWEAVLVNDGSRDNSLEILRSLHERDPRMRYVGLSRNFGKEIAMLAGMDYAEGDAVVIMDADLQHPIEAIPSMIAEWENGYDDVYGQRTTRGKEPWLRRKLSLAYYDILRKSSRIEILPNVGDFRLLDRRVIDAIRSLRESQRYTKGLYCWVGYNKKGIPFEQKGREAGESSFKLRGLVNLAVEGITSYTTAPLRFASVMGIVVSALSIIYLLFIVGKTIFVGEPIQGFPTLMCVILFLGGCQLLAIGIIGEYVGRIFNETKNRPPYIVSEHDGKRD